MLINLRNALMAGKRLPYDAEVEYLQSTGTQWIDSGVVADDDVGVKMHVVSANRPSSTHMFFGVFGSNNRFGLGWNTIGQVFLWWNEATSISYTGTIIQDSDVALNCYNSRSWNIGTVASGNITSAYNSSNTEIRVLTGKRMDNGENVFSPFGLKFGAIQITKGNTLICDLIPVRKGTVGYLYDRVSGKLFGNSGTGDFVLGPDKN